MAWCDRCVRCPACGGQGRSTPTAVREYDLAGLVLELARVVAPQGRAARAGATPVGQTARIELCRARAFTGAAVLASARAGRGDASSIVRKLRASCRVHWHAEPSGCIRLNHMRGTRLLALCAAALVCATRRQPARTPRPHSLHNDVSPCLAHVVCAGGADVCTPPCATHAPQHSVPLARRHARTHPTVGSLALGATQSETLWRIILPMASPAIMTGLILAVARAAGEVAPLMLVGVVKLAPTLPVDGNFPFLHLERKFMHLGFHIYDVGFQSPNVEAARPLVYATSFLLITVIIGLNLAAIAIRNNLREKYRGLDQ